MTTTGDFEQVGTGLAVFGQAEPVEGVLRWLDSPQAVMEFVAGGDVDETIVLARGGTTTFLTPALAAGVKGILTLQGTPESHLGIISREYGMPTIMGVSFAKGIRSARGEVIPADGVRVRMDLSNGAQGFVAVEAGAPVDDSPVAENPELDAMMAEFAVLLEHYQGEIPHGPEGHAIMAARMTTDVLHLRPETLHRDLSPQEADEFMEYMGWEFWDALALRATEGESGLVPRQEYEAVGNVHNFERMPTYHRLITERIGVDGIIELGSKARTEVGTKVNLVHTWCQVLPPSFGRGVAVGLGLRPRGYNSEGMRGCIEFGRRLYAGAWGDGGSLFTPERGYRAPILEAEWIERFQADRIDFDDPEMTQRFQLFTASTEMFSFLQNVDCRLGLCDTGPYPLPGGGFVIVRDHFINERLWPWMDGLADDLPYAVVEAMFFRDADELLLRLLDIGTIFTEPGNYLQYLTGAAVYARDRWDTPISDLRKLDWAEMDRIQKRCTEASNPLYATIAGWSQREKVLNGAMVYYTGMTAPIAREAGVWDEIVRDHRHYEFDQITWDAYEQLVVQGKAAAFVPKLFIAGGACAPVSPPPSLDEASFAALYRIKLKGMVAELDDAARLEADGVVTSTASGYLLTEEGHARVDDALLVERARIDADALGSIYERFIAANGPFKELSSRWHAANEDERSALAGGMADLLEQVEPVLQRTAQIVPRFGAYPDRLTTAAARVEEGQHEWMTSPQLDSVHTVWMEIHEDYLATLGRSRESEGAF